MYACTRTRSRSRSQGLSDLIEFLADIEIDVPMAGKTPYTRTTLQPYNPTHDTLHPRLHHPALRLIFPESSAGKWLAIIVAKTLLCGALSFSYFSVSDVSDVMGNVNVAVNEKLLRVTVFFTNIVPRHAASKKPQFLE